VPHEDQDKVLSLDYVDELLEGDAISPISVTEDLYSEAMNEETRGKIKDLVSRIEAAGKAQGPAGLSVDRENIRRLRHLEGWIYVSAGKLGDLIEEELKESGVVMQIPDRLRHQLQDQSVYSARPVLTHPEVAEFVISRLASAAAEQGQSACVTNKPSAYAFNAIRSVSAKPQDMVEAHLITETLDLLVPADIESIGVEEYRELREAFSDYRDSVHQMMCFKLQNAGPFEPGEFENYSIRIRELAETIQASALKVERKIRTKRRREWKRAVVRDVLSLVGAGVGAGLGAGAVVGAVPGALAGAALPIVLEPLAKKVMKIQPIQVGGSESVRALAELRDAMTADRSLLSMIFPASARA
jgi:hypothetical protein